MNIDLHSQEGRDFLLGLGISIVVHVAVVIVLLMSWLVEESERAEEEPEEERAVEVVLEDFEEPPEEEKELASLENVESESVEPDIEPPVEEEEVADQQEEPEEEEEVETPEEEILEPEPAEEVEPLELPDEALLELYAVDQETNEEEPLEADHISDQANKVEEETVAEITTLEEIPHPEDEPEAPLDESETELEMAMLSPEEFIEPEFIDPNILDEVEEPAEDESFEEEQEEQEEQQEVVPQEFREYLDPSQMIADRGDPRPEVSNPQDESLFEVGQQRFDQLFEQERQEAISRQAPKGRRLLSRWRENEESLRASLENFLPHIQTGNHTSVNARAAAHASYIARIHRHIHANWALRFLPSLQSTYSNAHPLNNMELTTVVEIVIDAQSGEVLETGRVIPSGNTLFDGEALITAREIGRHPDPPAEIVSPDGKVYIHWTFWRDQRQCGSFGARIYRLDDESGRRAISDEEFDYIRPAGQP